MNAKPKVQKRPSRRVRSMRSAINRACEIIETADARLLATDGPCGGLPPDMSLAEWRELYTVLDKARHVRAGADPTPASRSASPQ